MQKTYDTAILFSVVIRPHRSSSVTTARIIAVLVTFVFSIIGIVFVLAGAWPILPFFGLEVVLLYACMRFNQFAGNASEVIALTRTALTVRRTDHWGKRDDFAFQPHWLQVNLLEAPGRDNRLELRSHGRSLVIAAFLMPQERQQLAFTLRRELQRLTSPTIA